MTTDDFVKDLSEDVIKVCLKELEGLYKTGILTDGETRGIAKKMLVPFHFDMGTAIKVAEDAILREVARRYLKNKQLKLAESEISFLRKLVKALVRYYDASSHAWERYSKGHTDGFQGVEKSGDKIEDEFDLSPWRAI